MIQSDLDRVDQVLRDLEAGKRSVGAPSLSHAWAVCTPCIIIKTPASRIGLYKCICLISVLSFICVFKVVEHEIQMAGSQHAVHGECFNFFIAGLLGLLLKCRICTRAARRIPTLTPALSLPSTASPWRASMSSLTRWIFLSGSSTRIRRLVKIAS